MKFFTRRDLSAISQQNIGLRLTNNLDERQRGGFGDAVPLGHLAGAEDIIRFVILATSDEPNLDEITTIYERYKDDDVASHQCLPRLMLHYAAKLNIGDAQARLEIAERQNVLKGLQTSAIEEEAKKLRAFYQNTHGIIMPLVDVAKNLPVLADELILNFNEKLKARLALNWQVYSNARDLDYLFLTSSDEQFYKNGRDFNRYPLGKCGSHGFQSGNIVKQCMFLGPNFEAFNTRQKREAKQKELAANIFTTIRRIITDNLNQRINGYYARVRAALDAHPSYPEQFGQAFDAVFGVMGQLLDSETLSFDEACDLSKRLQALAEHPENHEAFEAAVKDYEMLAGGVLYAYFMLVVGWAIRVVTFDQLGHDWISGAEASISLFSATDEMVSASVVACGAGG